MRQPSREEYRNAVVLAEAAIREALIPVPEEWTLAEKASARTTLEAAVTKFKAGSELTPAERRALAEELEASSKVPKRRGRPLGAGAAKKETIAALCALFALRNVPLPLYRNVHARHEYSRCDAVAEAMVACGLQRVCTYGAVEFRAKGMKRGLTILARAILKKLKNLEKRVQAIQQTIEHSRPGLKRLLTGWESIQKQISINAKRKG